MVKGFLPKCTDVGSTEALARFASDADPGTAEMEESGTLGSC